jgi:hypothetical protein
LDDGLQLHGLGDPVEGQKRDHQRVDDPPTTRISKNS